MAAMQHANSSAERSSAGRTYIKQTVPAYHTSQPQSYFKLLQQTSMKNQTSTLHYYVAP